MNHSTSLLERYLRRQNTGNRRAAPRFNVSGIPDFKGINLAEGPEVKLVNISRYGALIESRERLSTGPGIFLAITLGDKVHNIKGRVIHCCIHSRKNREIQYQTAVAFHEDFSILPAGPDKY